MGLLIKMKTRKYVEVLYDPILKNWDAVTEQELKRRGLERGKVTVICRPYSGSKKDPKMPSKLINGIEIPKPGDPRVIAVGRVLNIPPNECFQVDPKASA